MNYKITSIILTVAVLITSVMVISLGNSYVNEKNASDTLKTSLTAKSECFDKASDVLVLDLDIVDGFTIIQEENMFAYDNNLYLPDDYNRAIDLVNSWIDQRNKLVVDSCFDSVFLEVDSKIR